MTNTKPYVEYDATKHGGFRTSRFPGVCRWCGTPYQEGDKVNWNPRVKHTCCHAGCYGEYGAPVPKPYVPEYKPEPEPTFVAPPKPKVDQIATTDRTGLPQAIVDAIVPYLNGRLEGLVTREQVEKVIDKILGDRIFKTVTTVTIERQTDIPELNEVIDLGLQHKLFTKLLKAVKAGVHVWLTGPAGTGKTTAAKNVADALGLNFYFTGSIDTEYKLLGFVDAQGRIVNTQFKEAFTKGGVFLFDEVDSSLPAALLAFNAALANPFCAFPDGILPRHKDFVAIAAANTWGLGATNNYVGRVKLDAAFLDRFPAKIHWTIDEELEVAITPFGNQKWARRVQKFRSVVLSKALQGVMITPRASIGGAKLLAEGFTQDEVEELTMRCGMTDAQWNDVRSAVGVN